MATRIPTEHRAMRKRPKQQRSQNTVESIVEAGARVLAQRGWANFTTNEVAHTAGVSIESLYQYFPNNLAIAEAIRKRHLDEILKVLPDIKTQGERVPLEEHIGRLIDAVVTLHATNQDLHRVLIDEVPLAPREFYDAFEREYHRRYEDLIRAAAPPDDTETDHLVAARILADALEGIVHSASRRNELMSPVIKREATRMIMSYLLARERT
ncbi:TPA: TetR family transcriptional regulator [Serratia marcescens]|nr:TetR family transcriptional regulator [Serratia marcescens]HEJ6930146.1 TetR family transcriptional regulator [Serratia marcescens]HEJ7072898.1 TetR family transcriptional regulator [Serratia marcescens]HEJ7195939.1 TetR family transcriptional regulator [Serratia marcescens]